MSAQALAAFAEALLGRRGAGRQLSGVLGVDEVFGLAGSATTSRAAESISARCSSDPFFATQVRSKHQ
jgi:hypothetical protein